MCVVSGKVASYGAIGFALAVLTGQCLSNLKKKINLNAKNNCKGFHKYMYIYFYSVQEIDGSYFESFTALAWKQENQRQSLLKAAELSVTEPPPLEVGLGITPIDYSLPQNEKDKLYVEMLYTIANAVSI